MTTKLKSRFLLLVFVFSFLTLFGFSSKAQADITQAPDFSVTSFSLSPDQNTITFIVAGDSGDTYSSCGSDINWDTFGNGYVGGPTITTPYIVSNGTISAGSASGTISAGEITKLSNGQMGTACDSSFRYSQSLEGNVTPGTPGTFTVNNKTLNVSSLTNGSYTLSVSLCATAGTCSIATKAFTINRGYTVNATISGAGGSVTPTPQTVTAGGAVTFTLSPSPNYTPNQNDVNVDSANCNSGNLTAWSGNNYTTGTINGNCTYTFSFTATPAVTASCSVSSPVASGVDPSITFTTNSSSNNCYVRNDNIPFGFSPQPGQNVSSSGTIYKPGVQTAGSHQGSIYCQNSGNTANSGWQYCPYTVSAAPAPCGNGANNPPTCNTCPAGFTFNGSSCVAVSTDACGTSSGSTPRLTEPTTNPTACNPGTYANSPADTSTVGAQAWNWSCGTVTSCSAPKYGCRVATDSNYSLPQYGPNGPNNGYGCAGTCMNGGSNYPTCTPPPGMSGTISSPDCTIASGASSCTATISWSVTNPTTALGSSITSSYPSAGTTVSPPVSTGTADAGTKTSVTIPYNSRTFFLYNTGNQLASGTASALCASGTAWDGGKCAPAMTGTLTASNCTIASGASTCNSSLTWTTANPVATSAVTTPSSITVGSGNNGSATYGVSSGNRTFYLYNNALLLAQATAIATCAAGTTWDGSKCTVNTPPPSSVPVVTIWASPSTGTVNVIKPTILWSVTNAPTSCTASLDWSGSKGASGTEQQPVLTSVKTYQYKLTCTNAIGSGSGTANVIVSATSSGVTISLNPTSIYAGDSSALTWSGPSACVGTNFNTGNAASGTISVSPSITTTYSVTCGGVSNQATLIVKKKPIFIEN
jgi:hypothetical protein